MAYVDWVIKGREFVNCNCDFGCPCQFNALPTHGDCMAVAGFVIDEGHFGETSLDGLYAVGIMKWPGPIHEGNGAAQLIIDERGDEAQRQALVSILSGQETEPGATIWNVFSNTLTTVFEPLYKEIHFEVDVDGRQAKLVVEGLVDARSEPIRNPITGDEHRARIDMPDGFEYTLAEISSATSKVSGAIPMELTASHGHLAVLHLSTHGVVK